MKSTLSKDTPTLEIISKLRNGEISRRMLSGKQILGSIALLLSDGVTHASIAGLLKCSEKTVGRYAKQIRLDNAFKFSLQDAFETIGEYRMTTEHQLRRLNRIAATAQDDTAKLQASALVVKLWGDYIKTLLSLGCLPPTAFKYGEKMIASEATKPEARKSTAQKFQIKLDDFMHEMYPHERENVRKALKPIIERLEMSEEKKNENPESGA